MAASGQRRGSSLKLQPVTADLQGQEAERTSGIACGWAQPAAGCGPEPGAAWPGGRPGATRSPAGRLAPEARGHQTGWGVAMAHPQ